MNVQRFSAVYPEGNHSPANTPVNPHANLVYYTEKFADGTHATHNLQVGDKISIKVSSADLQYNRSLAKYERNECPDTGVNYDIFVTQVTENSFTTGQDGWVGNASGYFAKANQRSLSATIKKYALPTAILAVSAVFIRKALKK